MNLIGFPWTALMDMHPQRIYQIAWFVYGWVEREHVLNLTACAEGWMRAIGLPAARLEAPRQGIGGTVPPVAPQVLVSDGDRAEIPRHRSPRPVGRLS